MTANKELMSIMVWGLLLALTLPAEGKKRNEDEERPKNILNNALVRPLQKMSNKVTLSFQDVGVGDRLKQQQQGYQQDTETSAQAINPAVQNPLLYQNQGGFANLGGGVFGNQGLGINPYLNGGGFGGLGAAGAGGYQNPYLGGIGGGFGGFGGGLGVAPDIYTQGALAAQLYNNPLYGAGAQTLSGASLGINPLLLRGAQNSQYPIVGGVGAYNPYLAAQALLSPYSNYNQLYNYPFSSRFGIGAGTTGRSGLARFNSQNTNSNSNDE